MEAVGNKIRNDEGAYKRLEAYVSSHSEAHFSHGICPYCLEKAYQENGLEE